MRRVLRVLGVLLFLVVCSAVAFALVLRHSAPCGSAPVLPSSATLMKAVIYRCYGPPEVLKLEDVQKPQAGANRVLVRVHAASLNPYDWHFMRGSPYIARLSAGLGAPKDVRFGSDFAGTVEAVGANVQHFKVGDEVFGVADGALAQYATVREQGSIALMPRGASFEEAAAIPIAAITALQALRDHGRVRPGEKVLINGASGGVGTFAVQIAKALGAEVTGVTSTHNVDMVRSLGADHVIDYTEEDFTLGVIHYDLIVDTVGNHSFADYQRVLQPQGRVVVLGGPPGNWIGPMIGPLKVVLLGPFMHQKFVFFLAQLKQQDLATLAQLIQAGRLKSVIDRRYPLKEVPEAIAYLEAGHARGKVVIDVD